MRNAIPSSQAKSARRNPSLLEPRVLLDAAAAETLLEASAQSDTDVAAEPAEETPQASAPQTQEENTDPNALFSEVGGDGSREVYVIDAGVEGHEGLLAEIPPGAEIIIIDPDQSGLAQLNEALAALGSADIDALHIVSHGTSAAFRLGTDIVSADTLAGHVDALQSLGGFMAEEGDILLYGCDIAGTADGALFIADLARITGADIAASADATGGPFGNAVLEAQAGYGDVTAETWSAVGLLEVPLALDGVYAGREEGSAGSHYLGWAVDAEGDWAVAGGNRSGPGTAYVNVWFVRGAQRDETTINGPSGSTLSFGAAVSIDASTNTLVVGDPGAGKVYVYQYSSGTSSWSLVQTLNPGTSIGRWDNASVGGTQWLAIDGSHIAVGAPNEGGGTGRVFWYADTSANADWASYADGLFDEPGYGGENNTQRFGASVSIAENLLIVGSPGADGNGDDTWNNDSNHGAIFVYNWSKSSTTEPTGATAKTPAFRLVGQDDVDGVNGGSGVADAYFGAAVDIEYYSPTPGVPDSYRYTIVGGAPNEDSGKGELYVYQFTTLSGTTKASNIYGQTTGGGADKFGLGVAVSQGRLIIGAPNHNAIDDAAIFYYEAPNNDWSVLGTDTNDPASKGIYVKTFTPATYSGGATDRFGLGVGFAQGNLVVAGAPLFDTGATDRGAVAFYYVRTPVAVADSLTISEDEGNTQFDILSNDIWGNESSATVPVSLVTGSSYGTGAFVWNNAARRLEFNPGGTYEYLPEGETATAGVKYELTDELGGVNFKTQATVTMTINGANDNPVLDVGLSDVTVPLRNEPVGVPAGPQSISTGNITIPTNVVADIDQSDIIYYSLVSVTPLSGAPAAPGGFVTVTGNFNKVLGVNSGNIAYNLTGMTAETAYQITIRCMDRNTAGLYQDVTFTFYVARNNENPEIVGGGVPDYGDNNPVGDIVYEDAVFSQDISGYFSDPDPTTGLYPEVLTYSITSQSGAGPDWLSVSPSGIINGVPTNNNVGTHTVTVRATDIFGNYIEDTFTVLVTNTNDAPVLINDIDRVVSIKGETFSFNVNTGLVQWNGTPQPITDAGPYFTDVDNSTADGRTPSSGDVITYRAYDAITGEEITTTSGGTGNASWLLFNGTTFTGTSAGPLGSIVTVRLEATDLIGGSTPGGTTSTLFEIGVFPRDATSGTPVTYPGAENGGRLGYDVAINREGLHEGRWAVVGEPGGANGAGEIHIYENTNYANPALAPAWTLRNSFSGAANARLGTAVDIAADGASGWRIVAGAPMENNGRGAVYYYANTAGTSGGWAVHSTAKGIAFDAANGDRFGSAVAINELGNFVLVGAPLDDNARGVNAGASYMYGWGSATGTGQRLPTLDSGETTAAGDLYGSSVAFDQNMLVVGAFRDDHSGKADAGSVYVYSTDNTSYQKLIKTQDVRSNDYFGWSLDVESFDSGNRVVVAVGAYNDDVMGDNAGAVYIFRSDGMVADNADNDGDLDTLVEQSRITAYDADPYENFGYSVAVDVDGDAANGALRVAVGSTLGGTSPGVGYAYRYWAGYGWTGQRIVAPTYAPTTNEGNQFSAAVDIAGSRVMLGAPNADRSGTASAGLFYGIGLTVTGAQSPIEVSPLSGNIVKSIDTGQPAPVIVPAAIVPAVNVPAANVPEQPQVPGSTGGTFTAASVPLWEPLLRPVEDWTTMPASSLDWFADFDERRRQADMLYSDALLFDARTLAGTPMIPATALEGVEGPAPAGQKGVEDVEALPTEDGDGAEPAGQGQVEVPLVRNGLSGRLGELHGHASVRSDALLKALSQVA